MKLWIKILVSFGVLSLLFSILPWHEVLDSVKRLSGIVWFSVLLFFLAGHIVGSLKWSLLVRTLGAPLNWLEGIRCYAAGLFANLCLPGIVGGDVIRATIASRVSGRVEAVILGSVGDRMIDLLALALIVVLGSLVAGTAVTSETLKAAILLIGVGSVFAFLLALTVLRRPLRSWSPKVRRRIGRTLVALRQLRRRPRIALLALVLALSIQGTFVLLNAWIGRSLDIEVPVSVWLVVWPLAKLAGLLPVSLGGLGVRDATLAALLSSFGVRPASGVVASLVWQSILLAGGLLAGLYWWMISSKRADTRAAGILRNAPHSAKGPHGDS